MDNGSYKDLLIKRTYQFSLETLRLIDDISQKSFSTQTISKQLVRSATSIGANVVEAQASSSKKDFANFLNHALKSANETEYWLKLLKDSNALVDSRIDQLINESNQLAKMLGSSVAKMRKNF